jgi:nitronate monooxygenase
VVKQFLRALPAPSVPSRRWRAFGTPALAAAVSNAGGLGSLGVGATNAEGAKKMIAAFRALSARSLNVNVFCHQPAKADARLENAWIERLRPEFARSGATPPTHLTEIYRSFLEDNDILATLLQEKPTTVSFHFGIPAPERVRALRNAGIVLLATATNPPEAQAVADAGIDAVMAQGYALHGHDSSDLRPARALPDRPFHRLGRRCIGW